MWHTSKCQRKATTDGFCFQHHPDAEKHRREKADRRYKEKQAAEKRQRIAWAIDDLRIAGWTIRPPDPQKTIEEALADL
jgi:hypothetical protein